MAELRAQLAEAQATLQAIRSGEVDAVVVAGKKGPQVYTLEGAEHAYRVLIESMNEGALTLTADETILYANQCFATLIKRPLEQLAGTSFRRFLTAGDRQSLRALMKRARKTGAKLPVNLQTGPGSPVPVLISIRPLAKAAGQGAKFGLVVTDMTEARRNEELLRAFSHRLVQVQESERGRVALELHDHITQLLCAILVRSQTLADTIPAHNGPARAEAGKLRDLVGQAAEEVERISRRLRPSVLSELGLVAVVGSDTAEFAKRTGIAVALNCEELTARLSAEAELAFYRILQEALNNVDRHAGARQVTVALRQQGAVVELVVQDDGIGFDPEHKPVGRDALRGLGLLGMRERASGVGGSLTIVSAPGGGTVICARIPYATGTGRTPARPSKLVA